MKTFLLFDGFYDSIYSDELNDAIMNAACEHDEIDFKKAYDYLAKQYVKAFHNVLWNELEYEIDFEMDFLALKSPRFYNFETDAILAEVSDNLAEHMYMCVDLTTLKQVIEDRHTSYDGFVSRYSNDWEVWMKTPFADWDENQLETLLLAFMETKDIDYDDLRSRIFEDMLSNGDFDDAVYFSTEFEELE